MAESRILHKEYVEHSDTFLCIRAKMSVYEDGAKWVTKKIHFSEIAKIKVDSGGATEKFQMMVEAEPEHIVGEHYHVGEWWGIDISQQAYGALLRDWSKYKEEAEQ